MNILTIDLEDWFHSYNFSRFIRFEGWDNQECRIVNNTKKILNILDSHNTKATFFVLGWVADKFPSLVREIKEKDHEIACHGYSHKPIFLMNPEEFSKDLDKSVKAIKKASGVKPIGYRAPSFSIVKKTLWALNILKEKGFKYDSSMMPVSKHPDYGIKGIPRKPFKIKGLLEIPMTTTYGLPIGGGYFRIYPYLLTKHLIKKKNTIFYIHPWEFDPKMPRHKLTFTKRFRHYTGLNRTEKKFNKLLRDFRFCRINDIL